MPSAKESVLMKIKMLKLEEQLDFELSDLVIKNVYFLDSILSEIIVQPISENADFTINKDSSGTYSLDIKVNSKSQNVAELDIFLQSDGIRIDVDGIPELFEWGNKHLEVSKDEAIATIKNIFTGYFLIERSGRSIFINLFDTNGFHYKTISRNNFLHFLTGTYLKTNSFQRLFLPIYPLNKCN